MEKEEQTHESSSARRRFFRRLVGVAAATGASGLLLGKLSEPVSAVAAGDVAFADGAGGVNYDTNFHWDNTNKYLGIGTSSPTAALDIIFGATGSMRAGTPGGSGPGWIAFSPEGSRRDIAFTNWGIGMGASPSSSAPLSQLVVHENGNIGIRTIAPTAALHIVNTSPSADGLFATASTGGIIAAVRGENSSAASAAYGVLGRIGDAPLPPTSEAAAAVRGVCPFSASGQGVTGSGGNGVVGYGLFAGGHFEGAGTAAGTVGLFAGSPLGVGFAGGSRLAVQSAGDVLPTSDNTWDCGAAGARWRLLRAVTVTSGDLVYENGVRSTEEGDGIAFYNPKGTKIAVLDGEGNWHIKGDIIRDL